MAYDTNTWKTFRKESTTSIITEVVKAIAVQAKDSKLENIELDTSLQKLMIGMVNREVDLEYNTEDRKEIACRTPKALCTLAKLTSKALDKAGYKASCYDLQRKVALIKGIDMAVILSMSDTMRDTKDSLEGWKDTLKTFQAILARHSVKVNGSK
jgi:hypothetical protein